MNSLFCRIIQIDGICCAFLFSGREWYFPPVGGFRFGLFTVPPDRAMATAPPGDTEAALKEAEEKLPGAVGYLEPDHPGMHTTDTIDFEYVISGEVWLELDDGVEVHLRAGDTVVQNGTRHAWRNKSSEPCQMLVVLIGANRAAPTRPNQVLQPTADRSDV